MTDVLNRSLQEAHEKRMLAEQRPAAPDTGPSGAVINADGMVVHLLFGQTGAIEPGLTLIVGNFSEPGTEVGPTGATLEERLSAIEALLP